MKEYINAYAGLCMEHLHAVEMRNRTSKVSKSRHTHTHEREREREREKGPRLLSLMKARSVEVI